MVHERDDSPHDPFLHVLELQLVDQTERGLWLETCILTEVQLVDNKGRRLHAGGLFLFQHPWAFGSMANRRTRR